MTIQPNYHLEFNKEDQTLESINGVNARFHKVGYGQHGQIGSAIKNLHKDSHVNLGCEVGQFGTSDFTIAFGMLIKNTHKQKDLDIISNRNVGGHGNWFSVRQIGGSQIQFEVDENNKGKHYARARTKAILQRNKWCHVALVRQGPTLKIYFNGIIVAESNAKNNGVANIHSSVETKLGHWKRHTSTAHYEDLRIYRQALTENEIQALVPPPNQLLKHGEIELTSNDGARRVFNHDDADLFEYSNTFIKLRVGSGTGATIYSEEDFGGHSHKLYSGVSDTRSGRVKSFPKSIHIWKAAGEPYQGHWVIRSATGKFLSWARGQLLTTEKCDKNALFDFNFSQNYGQLQLIPVSRQESGQFVIEDQMVPLIVNDTETSVDAFSIEHPTHSLWLREDEQGQFSWTADQEERTTFFRFVKFAPHESQVGDLVEGEVALYQHVAYHGHVWILSDKYKDNAGNFASLEKFFGLNNTTSSIRLGQNTGVTLFANLNQKIKESDRENQIEDFVENQPRLFNTQLGNDNISSLKIFKRVPASELFTSVTSKLSQDYRMAGEELEEFSAYRTILHLDSEVKEVEVSATDLTTIEVEGETYEIDEVRSVSLKPNQINQIMITSEADDIDTPSLKFRTQDMAENERVVVSPSQQVQKQISELETDALWNAKDAKGELIVDQKKHSKADVASVQNTIKRVMSSVTLKQDSVVDSTNDFDVFDEKANGNSSEIVVDTDNTSPWEINFDDAASIASPNFQRSALISGGNASARATAPSSNKPSNNGIWEQKVDQKDFQKLLSQSENSSASGTPQQFPTPVTKTGLGTVRALSIRSFGRVFRRIRDAVKRATKVVIGFANNVVNAIVTVAGKVVNFVLDTVQKVAEFVQAVVEKVVKTIRQFIEFLRFLFDWKDILKTQRFIKDSINSGFDSAADLVDSAKKPIAEAISSVQNSVSDGFDGLIESLGVNPAEVASDKSKLPEAAEWLLNKIFGSIGPGKSPVLSLANGALTAPSSNNGFSNLQKALGKLVTMGVGTLTEGLIETIESFITNPSRPELALAVVLNLVKEVSIQALDIMEDLMMVLLDAVIAGINILQEILNKEVKIPLISALFKLIGAGELSIINLVTILVAIPTTVVSKLMFKERPFADLDVPAIADTNTSTIAETEFSAALVQSRSALVEPRNLDTQTETEDDSAKRLRHRRMVIGFGVLSTHAGLLSGMFASFLDAQPEQADDDEGKGTFFLEAFTLGLDWISWLGTFPASPDNPGGFPYALHKHKVSKTQNPQEYWQRVVWGFRTFVLAADTIYFVTSAVMNGKTANKDSLSSPNLSGYLDLFRSPSGVGSSLGAIPSLGSSLGSHTSLGGNSSVNPAPSVGSSVGSGSANSLNNLQRLRRANAITIGFYTAVSAVDLVLTCIYLSKIPKKDKPQLTIAKEVILILPNILAPVRLMGLKASIALGITRFVATFSSYVMGLILMKRTADDLK